MNFYQMTIDQIVQELKTNTQNGLTKNEIKKRLHEYGLNILPEKKPFHPFKIFLKQFTNPLIFILLIAAVASILLKESADAIVITIAVIINTILGFIQEWKAEKAVFALKKFAVPHCKVKRDEKIILIEAKNLVPGDIILLSAGNKIPADARLFQIIDFQVDEAILTGESKPIKKNLNKIEQEITVGDRTNMVFSGTNVLSGKAQAIVTQTGSDTYLGHITQLVTQTEEQKTPLQEQIKKLSWWIAGIFLSITTLIFLLGLIKGIPFHKIIMIAIALSVAAIPEGLLVAVTVILAIGMQQMLKRHALVRHLIAAETLGSVSVICTDKTGTITQGHMQVTQIITKNYNLKIEDTITNELPDEIKNILTVCILNNDAQFDEHLKKIIGNPTEIALFQAAQKAKIDILQIQKKFNRLNEIPFSSDLKYMVTSHKIDTHEEVIIKGASEKIFAMCTENETLNKFKTEEIDMTKNGLRVLAVATKTCPDVDCKIDFKKDLFDLNFIGLIGIQDPLRSTAMATVNELKKAGIRVVLVTGDHKDTAASIAKKVGIDHRTNGILTGMELDEMSEKQLTQKITDIDVFARVEPRHKIMIVKAWQSLGKSVAMTGDGVNDAPALKAADIGVALGSGSDVAHEISDMVILDDNLSTIDKAVMQGRKIFDNIRKVIVYLMADSFSEIVLIAGSILLGLPLPLLASQILWVNLIGDGFPSLALTVEPAEPEIMSEKPRDKNEPVINTQMKILIFIIGIITDLGLFTLYIILLRYNLDLRHLRTILFTAVTINSLFYVFSIRSMRRSIFRMNPFSNKWMFPAVGAGFLIQLAVVYIPSLQKIFSTVSLNFLEWGIILGLASIKILAIEITKEIFIIKKWLENKNYTMKINHTK